MIGPLKGLQGPVGRSDPAPSQLLAEGWLGAGPVRPTAFPSPAGSGLGVPSPTLARLCLDRGAALLPVGAATLSFSGGVAGKVVE